LIAAGRATLAPVSASAVRPEFGPSLPELLRPLPRAAKLALAALVVLALAALVGWVGWGRGPAAVQRAVVEGAVPFNIAIPAGFERVTAPEGAALALRSAGSEVEVAPLRLPAYRGDVSAALMQLSTGREDRLRASLDGYVLRQEGRTRINEQPGYQLHYQFRDGDRTAYGRLVLLVQNEEDDPRPRKGVVLDLRTQRGPAVPSVGAVGNNGSLKTALRSFRFGTDAP
jgi:hypothetical protein